MVTEPVAGSLDWSNMDALDLDQFALIILTFKQFSELYFMPAESD
jgi:hypothetical protein